MAERIGDDNLNILVGTADADFFLGLGGLDSLRGLGGDDIYLLFDTTFSVYDTITEDVGGGIDSIVVTAATDQQTSLLISRYTLDLNVENGTVGGIDTQLSSDLGFTLIGNGLNNALTGNRVFNTLDGAGGDDILYGGLGFDTLIGGLGDDVFILRDTNFGGYDSIVENAGGGTDTAVVGAGGTYTLAANVENGIAEESDVGFGITGNSLANNLTGNRAANALAGAGGNDTLNGGLGFDSLSGGDGDDLYLLLDANFNQHDIVTEAAGGGIDTVVVQYAISTQFLPPFNIPIQTPVVTYVLAANVENGIIGGADTQTGTDNAFVLVGNGLDNVLTGNRVGNALAGAGGNDTLNGGLGLDGLTGGDGDDVFILLDTTSGAYDSITEEVSGGIDTAIVGAGSTYTLAGNVENGVVAGIDTGFANDIGFGITGNALDNALTGNRASNALAGAGGNDTLNGGLGLDTLNGGDGDDLYLLLDANLNTYDIVSEAAGGGIDTVVVQFAISTLLLPPFNTPIQTPVTTYVLAANVENGTIGGLGTQTGADIGFVLIGNGLDNVLTGNRAGNALVGAGGNDTLNGGLDFDELNGGDGDDVYVLDDKNLRSGVSVYDTITEAAGGGTDTVLVRGFENSATPGNAYTLGANLENATLVNNSLNIGLTGNAADNVLAGNGGNNRITGLGGNDTLDGQVGVDTLVGGSGDDTYVLGDYSGLSIASLGSYDTVVETAGGGTDSVILTVLPNYNQILSVNSYTLTANVENATLVASPVYAIAFDLTGNALGNELTGHEQKNTILGLGGNDTLNGGLGLDVLDGGSGDDIFILDDMTLGASGVSTYDTIIEAAGGGTDTVLVRGIERNGTYTLATNFENGTLFGNSQNFNLTGNAANNVLAGNGGNNLLTGLGGNDTLDGQVGVDTLVGGSGNDTYILSDYSVDFVGGQGSYDTVTEAAGGGTDSVFITALPNNNAILTVNGYTLTANVENATIVSSPVYDIAFNLTGNALANTLIGNDTANTLNGLAGADIMAGAGGDDTYYVDVAGDAVYEDASAAVGGTADRVLASVSYGLTAGSGVETLATTNNAGTTGGIKLTGNELSNTVLGNASANTLNGGGGKDTLTGFGGADTFLFNTALNTLSGASFASLSATANVDRLTDFNVASDTIHLENAVFGGLAAGALAAGAFRAGTAALDANDHIIYNSATGALVFDANGNTAGGTHLFAFVTPGLAITADDFLVV